LKRMFLFSARRQGLAPPERPGQPDVEGKFQPTKQKKTARVQMAKAVVIQGIMGE